MTIDRLRLVNLFLKNNVNETTKYLIKTNFKFDIRNNYEKINSKPKNMSELEYQNKSWLFKNKNQGIPIGNLTSQFGANLYLNSLDHFIQRTLKPNGYLRYMDD